jgi:hypothetical protein
LPVQGERNEKTVYRALFHRQEMVAAMPVRFSLALLFLTLVTTTSVFASCVTNNFRFFARGDAVTANESLTGGDTCFHTLRNYAPSGNTFRQIAISKNPSHGTLTIGGSDFQYRSNQGYRGSDSYAVKICMESPRGSGCSTVAFNADIN